MADRPTFRFTRSEQGVGIPRPVAVTFRPQEALESSLKYPRRHAEEHPGLAQQIWRADPGNHNLGSSFKRQHDAIDPNASKASADDSSAIRLQPAYSLCRICRHGNMCRATRSPYAVATAMAIAGSVTSRANKINEPKMVASRNQ